MTYLRAIAYRYLAGGLSFSTTALRRSENGRICTQLNVSLDRDVFLRTLIRELSGTLQEVVGLKEASGFVSIVGQHMGDYINDQYAQALGTTILSRRQVADVFVDLKRRIQGDFYIIEESDEKIVLGNRACPFGDKVVGRPAMCMMTSNVFGAIAARNLSYAKVELQQTNRRGPARVPRRRVPENHGGLPGSERPRVFRR